MRFEIDLLTLLQLIIQGGTRERKGSLLPQISHNVIEFFDIKRRNSNIIALPIIPFNRP